MTTRQAIAIVLVAAAAVLAACGAKPLDYTPVSEIPEGPGVLTGEEGEYTIFDSKTRDTQKEPAAKPTAGSGPAEPSDSAAGTAGQAHDAREFEEFQRWTKDKQDFEEFQRWKKSEQGSKEYQEFLEWQKWREYKKWQERQPPSK